jgi:predicted N-acyltransferase
MRVAIHRSIRDIPRPSWALLTKEDDVDVGYEYIRSLEDLDPDNRRIFACYDPDGAIVCACFAGMVSERAPFTSRPTWLLTSPQFVRTPPHAGRDQDDREVIEAARRLCGDDSLSSADDALIAIGHRLEREVCPEVLVRNMWDSRVIAAPTAPEEVRRKGLVALIEALMTYAEEHSYQSVNFIYTPASDLLLVSVLEGLGFVGGTLCAVSYFDLSGCANLEEYLATLSKGRRRVWRTDLRRFQETALTARPIEHADYLREIAELELSNMTKHGFTMPISAVERFHRLLREHVGDRIRAFGAFDGTRLVASEVCMMGDRTLYCLTYGADYEVVGRLYTYQMIGHYLPFQLALQEGLQQVGAGPEAYPAKVLRGAKLRPMKMFIWSPRESARDLARQWLGLVEKRTEEYLRDLVRHW